MKHTTANHPSNPLHVHNTGHFDGEPTGNLFTLAKETGIKGIAQTEHNNPSLAALQKP